MTQAIIAQAQQYINFLEATTLSLAHFIESKGLDEEFGRWLVARSATKCENTMQKEKQL
jgi:hypothetical protein